MFDLSAFQRIQASRCATSTHGRSVPIEPRIVDIVKPKQNRPKQQTQEKRIIRYLNPAFETTAFV